MARESYNFYIIDHQASALMPALDGSGLTNSQMFDLTHDKRRANDEFHTQAVY